MSNWTVSVSTEVTGSYYCSEIRVYPPKVANVFRTAHNDPEMSERQREHIEWQLKREVVLEVLNDPVFTEIVREKTNEAFNQGRKSGSVGGYL